MAPSDENKEMDPESKDSSLSQCVKVAVFIKPLLTSAGTDSITVVPGGGESKIFQEEVFDLLGPPAISISVAEVTSLADPARVPIQIRETPNGEITLDGVTEQEARTKEERDGYPSPHEGWNLVLLLPE